MSTTSAADRSTRQVCTAESCGSEPSLGTSLHWVAEPAKAARIAKRQGKLVFLIQVSGNFAREEFT
ncbi:MAG: hypothetical protein ACE5KM_07145 [Planctomycetaceae bacterium]